MLAIRNFGHYWSKDLVSWGTPGRANAGRLLGYQLRDRRPFVVDFGEQIGIYVLFSNSREPIYIGQSGNGDQRLLARLRQHSQGPLRDRWTNFSWFGFRGVNNTAVLSEHQRPDSRCAGSHADALDEIEAILLQLLEPRLNKQGPKWGDAAEYLQDVPWQHGEASEPVDYNTQLLLGKLESLEQEVQEMKAKI